MVHILASAGFMLAMLGALALIAVTLLAEQEKIAIALGLVPATAPRMSRNPVRVRSVRQVSAPARATQSQPQRAAA